MESIAKGKGSPSDLFKAITSESNNLSVTKDDF